MRLFDCCAGDAASPAKADLRRQKLIEAARVLFADQGFHGTGMAQIASASGIKVGQIYRDFPSKEAIVGAIVENDLVAFLDETSLSTAIAARDRPTIRRWIVHLVCGKDEHDQLIPEICAEAARNERIAAIMDRVDARVRDGLVKGLRVFAPEPAKAADVATAVDLIMTLTIGVASQRNIRPDQDLTGLCRRIERLIETELDALEHAPVPA